MSVRMTVPPCLTLGPIRTRFAFRASFVSRENGFVGAGNCFVTPERTKQVQGIAR
jgi:hypothetical protein